MIHINYEIGNMDFCNKRDGVVEISDSGHNNGLCIYFCEYGDDGNRNNLLTMYPKEIQIKQIIHALKCCIGARKFDDEEEDVD